MASTSVYLISQNYLRENSPITDNVQEKDLFPHIIAAQETYTQKILGSKFYEHIIEAFSAQTLNANEIELVQNYIKPQVLWRTVDLALPWVANNIRGKGILKNTDENAVVSDFREMNYLRNEASNRAEQNEQLLFDYLQKNQSLFPEYKDQQDALIEKSDDDNQYDNGFLFY